MTQPTISQTVSGSGTATSSISLTSWTPAANDLIIVWVAIRQTVTVSSVTGNGLTFVNVSGATRTGTQSQERLECWRAQGASPSAGQITVNFASSAVAAVAVAHRLAGANTGGTNGSTAVEVAASADTGATDTASPSVDITTVSADSLVLAGVSHRNRTFSVGTGETAISLNNTVGTAGDQTSLSTEYQGVTSASTVTIDGSLSAAIDWTIGAVAIKPAGNSIALSSTIAGASSTPDTAAAKVARALSSTIAGASSTPDTATAAIARALSSTLGSTSSTPDTVTLKRLLQAVVTLASTSSTPDTPTLISLVAFTATIAGASSTPDTAAAKVARALSSTLGSTSSTPDTVTLKAARAFAAAIAGASSTPDTVTLARLLQAVVTIAGASSASDTVTLRTLVPLAATIAGASSTPDTAAARVARALSVSIASRSRTSDLPMPTWANLLRVLARARIFVATTRRTYAAPAITRTFVATTRRTYAVPVITRRIEAQAMALAEIAKDPQAVLDYTIDWSTYLADGDEIAGSTWSVDAGLTVDSNSSTTTTTSVRLSGGTANTKYTAKNVVSLLSGQTDVRRLVVVVTEM